MAFRILIADDNEVARGLLRDIVESHSGWEVCGEGQDGQQAVALAAELKPDLIILDLAMPTMDGFSAAREILKAQPTIPIVLHTLHAFDHLELEAKKNGIRAVVSKMDTNGTLENSVKMLLGEKQSALIVSPLPEITPVTMVPDAPAVQAKAAELSAPADPAPDAGIKAN
jgi:DNA-binding NarL/FixJ family response regulator